MTQETVLQKIEMIRNALLDQMEKEASNNDPVVLAEWYAFPTFIHRLYRRSFSHDSQRHQFEESFCEMKSNRERVKMFVGANKIIRNFKSQIHRMIKENNRERGQSSIKFQLFRKKATPKLLQAETEAVDESSFTFPPRHSLYSRSFKGYKEHDDFPGLSEGLALELIPPKRRGLVAKVDYPPKAILSIDRAVATWLSPNLYGQYCTFCMIRLDAKRVQCSSCKICYFCNEQCFNQALESFHQVECGAMPILKQSSIIHFVVRIINIVGIHKVLEGEWERMGKIFPSPGGDYVRRFVDLEDSVENITNMDLLSFTNSSLFIALFLEHTKLINHPVNLVHLATSLMSIVISMSRNIYTIYDHRFQPPTGKHSKGKGKPDMLVEGITREIGYGLFYASSMFNHSCVPKAFAMFLGDHIVISTYNDIKPGEEITISYGTSYPDTHYEKRQEKLKDNFYFNCVCEQCVIEASNEQSQKSRPKRSKSPKRGQKVKSGA